MAKVYFHKKGKDLRAQIKQDDDEHDRQHRNNVEQKAIQGDARSQYELADCFSSGKGGEQDDIEAFNWYKKAAEQGYVNAQTRLADYYYFGVGTEQNYTQAVYWYEKAVEQGYILVHSRLADCYFQGYGVKQDAVKAVKLLEKDIETVTEYKQHQLNAKFPSIENNTRSYYAEMAEKFPDKVLYPPIEQKIKSDYESCVRNIEQNEEQNIAYIRNKLADCYFQGLGGKKDPIKAIEMLKIAAESGKNLLALRRLAICYFFGKGVEQNYRIACRFFEDAICISEERLHERQINPGHLQAELGIVHYRKTPCDLNLAIERFIMSEDGLGFLWLAYTCKNYPDNVVNFLKKNNKKKLTNNTPEIYSQLSALESIISPQKQLIDTRQLNQLINSLLCKTAAILFLQDSGETYCDLDIINYDFPEEIISFLENHINDETLYNAPPSIIGFPLSNQSSPAKVILAFYYRMKERINKDNESLSLSYLNQAAGDGDIIACRELGIKYKKEKKFDNAIKYFEKIKFCIDYHNCDKNTANEIVNFAKQEVINIELFLKYKRELEGRNIGTNLNYKQELDAKHKELEQTKAAIEILHKEELESAIKQKEAANKALQEKEKELEDMMSMFAHKFRAPLDNIIYNTTHENQVKMYTEAALTMRGLLDIFSIISTNPEILKKKLIEDNQGTGSLLSLFSKNLNMVLLHLLSFSGREKIRQHYIAYAKAHGLCDANISRKTWREDYFELEHCLQKEWEQSFALLLNQSTSLTALLDWLAQHFFTLELIGFDRGDILFDEYGVTESFLTIILNEILVNAFKYYASENKEAVIVEWMERDNQQVLCCRNPSVGTERTIFKGSQKGHTFLSTLARNIGSQFNKPIPQDNFVVEFGIPNELLISNEAKQ